ncbi:MAG TPA: hypothetical protein VF591_18130 [Pyrinomonadaceae bacterium]
MERAIAFILERQAQFAANQQRHGETLLNHEEFMREHEETMRRVEAAQELTTLQVQHLGGAMIELAEAHTRTEKTLAETNGKLNALIDTVERHISEGRNGKA